MLAISFLISAWYIFFISNASCSVSQSEVSSTKFCNIFAVGVLDAHFAFIASDIALYESSAISTLAFTFFTASHIFAPTSSILSTTDCAVVCKSVRSHFNFPVLTSE